MKKKVSLIIAILIMAITPMSALAADIPTTIEDNVILWMDETSVYEDFASADVVVIPEGMLEICKDYAKSLVDDGKILHIKDTSMNKEELATYFGIPKETRDIYNNLEHVATTIFKKDSHYLFGYIHVNVEKSEKGRSASFAKSLVSDEDAIRSSLKMHEQLQTGLNFTTDERVIPDGASRHFMGSVNVYDTSSNRNKLGSASLFESVYDRGYVPVNNVDKFIFDVITTFDVDAEDITYVKKFDARMHGNVVGQQMLAYSFLPSVYSYTEGISASINMGGPMAGGTSSWTYPAGAHRVDNLPEFSSNYVDYRVETLEKIYGGVWQIAPGIKIAATAKKGSRGAFSKITIPVLAYDGYTSLKDYTTEIGGWF